MPEPNSQPTIFPAIPNHLFESTPRKHRRRSRGGKHNRPSPLGKATVRPASSSTSTPDSSPQRKSQPRPHEGESKELERDPPPHLRPPMGERALADTVAIMRNNMRVLEEVQTSLDSGLDDVHTSLAATNERINGLLEEMLVGQQQMMDLVVRIMERVMRIDRNIAVPQ